jgi:hypothetical protein
MEAIDLSKEIPAYRHRYRFHLLILMAIALALPALFLGRAQTQEWERKEVEQFDRQSLMIAKLIARSIGIQIDDRARALEAFAGQVEIQGSANPGLLQKMIAAQKNGFPESAISYVSRMGGFLSAVDPPFNQPGTSLEGAHPSVIHTDSIDLPHIRQGGPSGRPVRIATPIHDAEGRAIAYVENRVDLADMIQSQAERLSIGVEDLKVVVMDREGRVLAHPEEEARREMHNLSLVPLFQPTNSPEGEIRAGVDEKGIGVRGAVASISTRGLNWRVVAYRPKASIEPQVSAARRQTWEVVGAGLIGSLLLAVYSFRLDKDQQADRIAREAPVKKR